MVLTADQTEQNGTRVISYKGADIYYCSPYNIKRRRTIQPYVCTADGPETGDFRFAGKPFWMFFRLSALIEIDDFNVFH